MSNLDFLDNGEGFKIKVKLVHPDAKMPCQAQPGDAGFDLFACEPCVLNFGSSTLVDTGVSIEMPTGFEAQVRSRSGLALDHGVFCVNGIGTIDSGYRGKIGVILSTLKLGGYQINVGDKIAQLVFNAIPDIRLVIADTLSETSRGANGYGSTGR